MRYSSVDMRQLLEAEPFLAYLGLEVVEAYDGVAILRLPVRPDVTNHLGSTHGGAQYALGEATAIALAATLFPEHIECLNLLTADATITYHRVARGDLTGWAALPIERCERIRREFGAKGHARFPIHVSLTDATPDDGSLDSVVVATLMVECSVHDRVCETSA